MHLVLRSSRATGPQSFALKRHRKAIAGLVLGQAAQWGVKIDQFANVGNHLHLLVRLSNRRTYKPFICAVTGGIAAIVTRGEKLAGKFWDYRPFSRIVFGQRGYLTIRDYISVNQFEGGGVSRSLATLLVRGGVAVSSG